MSHHLPHHLVVRKEICEIYGILDICNKLSERLCDLRAEKIGRVLYHSGLLETTNIRKLMTVWDLINGADDIARNEVVNVIDKPVYSKRKCYPVKVARAAIKHALTNEEKFCAQVYNRIDIFTPAFEDDELKGMVVGLLTMHKTTNRGLKCWYFERIFRLICLLNYDKDPETNAKIIEGITKIKNSDAILCKFINWVMGVSYSLSDLSFRTQGTKLIPPILSIIYNYLLRPSQKSIRSEAIKLV